MRVALRIYKTFHLPDHGYFDRKFSIGMASHDGCILINGMAPFIAPLREGGLKVYPEYDLRGESANPNGFCARYFYSYFGTKKMGLS